MEKYEEEAEKTAFERAKAAYGSGAYDDATLEFLFPELKESENEKVRKFLIGYFDKLVDKNSEWGLTEETRDRILTWLEKQKENTEKEYVFEYVFRPLAGTDITIAAEQAIRMANEGHHLVLAFNGAYIPVRKGNNAKDIVDIYDAYLEKQKEQNAVPSRETILGIWELGNLWKENPEERNGLTQLQYIQKYWFAKNDYQKEQNCAEIAPNQFDGITYGMQGYSTAKPAEWSEDEEKDIQEASECLREYANNYVQGGNSKLYVQSLADRIESLRPQSHWKPSKEQLEAARYVSQFDYGGHKAALISLYEQLKQI